MRKSMIALVMLCIVGCSPIALSGCGGGFGEGVATGAAVAGAIVGAREALIQREADLNARYEAALNEYETAVTDMEKKVAATKIKSLEEQLKENKVWQLTALLAEQGTKTDWNNPQAVAAFSQLAVMLGMGGYFARQMRKKEKSK